jgi:hypothetical protein
VPGEHVLRHGMVRDAGVPPLSSGTNRTRVQTAGSVPRHTMRKAMRMRAKDLRFESFVPQEDPAYCFDAPSWAIARFAGGQGLGEVVPPQRKRPV